MRNILKNKRGEGHIGTAMKIIIGVVIGALILGGLYLLFDNVILDSTAARIEALFDVSQDNMSARCELDGSGAYHLQYTYDGEQWFEAELVDMSADASVKAFVSDGKETPTYCAVVIDGNKFHVIASEDGGVTWNSRKAWDYNGNTSNFLLTYTSGFKLTFKTGSTNYTATSANGLTWSDAWSEIHRP